MTFNSFEFMVFLPILFLVFYIVRSGFRWLLLLFASFLFYALLLEPLLIVVLLAVAAVTYYFGIKIQNEPVKKRKKRLLAAGVVFNIAVLAVIKYSGFLIGNLNSLAGVYSSTFELIETPVLPSIGVSYYTFQAISYLIDIKLGRLHPERHFGYFLLYLSFFPKLLQGPIERGKNLIPQLREKSEFNYDNVRSGLILFSWGLLKKVVIADRLALVVNTVYGQPEVFNGPQLIIATFFFSLQIYYDFSGYTDMALGAARLFNIELTQNFRRPYFSTSIADFWRRWHISFSKWLFDYIFHPLQIKFRKLKLYSSALALMVVFLVCGIWHGASWTFVIWGLINGVYMVVHALTQKQRKRWERSLRLDRVPRISQAMKIAWTFGLVTFAWIFFRAPTVSDAFSIVRSLPMETGNLLWSLITVDAISVKNILNIGAMGLAKEDLLIILILVTIAETVQYLAEKVSDIAGFIIEKPAILRWGYYYAAAVAILFFGAFNTSVKFIYLQF